MIALAVGAGSAPASPSAITRTLSVAPAAGAEGGRAVFTVRLAKPSAERVTVRYATSDMSARAGVDYVRQRGSLTFKPRQTSRRIVVRLLDDADPEPAETFTVYLSRPTNARLARAAARGAIFASDLPEPFTTLATIDASRQTGGNPAASATATLTFDAENASVRSTVSARGLGDRGGFVHLHRGSAGAEGPELASLAGPWGGNGTATSTASLSRAVILQIHAAPTDFYVELHTLNGAMRGQLRHVP